MDHRHGASGWLVLSTVVVVVVAVRMCQGWDGMGIYHPGTSAIVKLLGAVPALDLILIQRGRFRW